MIQNKLTLMYMNTNGIVKTTYSDEDFKQFSFQINEPFFPINLYLNGKLQICNQPNIDENVLSIINSDIVDVTGYDNSLFMHAGVINFYLDCLSDKFNKFHNSPILVPLLFECNYIKLSFYMAGNIPSVTAYQCRFNFENQVFEEILNPVITQNLLNFTSKFYQLYQFHFRVSQQIYVDGNDIYFNIDRNEFYFNDEKFVFGDNFLYSNKLIISNYPFYDIKNIPF